MGAFITISDPLASTIASVAQVIVAFVDLQKAVVDKATAAQVQTIVEDLINLNAPFNSLVKAFDHKFGIATLDPPKPS